MNLYNRSLGEVGDCTHKCMLPMPCDNMDIRNIQMNKVEECNIIALYIILELNY